MGGGVFIRTFVLCATNLFFKSTQIQKKCYDVRSVLEDHLTADRTSFSQRKLFTSY